MCVVETQMRCEHLCYDGPFLAQVRQCRLRLQVKGKFSTAPGAQGSLGWGHSGLGVPRCRVAALDSFMCQKSIELL